MSSPMVTHDEHGRHGSASHRWSLHPGALLLDGCALAGHDDGNRALLTAVLAAPRDARHDGQPRAGHEPRVRASIPVGETWKARRRLPSVAAQGDFGAR